MVSAEYFHIEMGSIYEDTLNYIVMFEISFILPNSMQSESLIKMYEMFQRSKNFELFTVLLRKQDTSFLGVGVVILMNAK
jgi:hypothetical protein